jgi:hypothetical protein
LPRSLRYCYVVHSDSGEVYEKVCKYKKLEDAVKALHKRVEELVEAGMGCEVIDKDSWGVDVYGCKGVLKDKENGIVREVNLVVRLDMGSKEERVENTLEESSRTPFRVFKHGR